jgi:hypothetical protein
MDRLRRRTLLRRARAANRSLGGLIMPCRRPRERRGGPPSRTSAACRRRRQRGEFEKRAPGRSRPPAPRKGRGAFRLALRRGRSSRFIAPVRKTATTNRFDPRGKRVAIIPSGRVDFSQPRRRGFRKRRGSCDAAGRFSQEFSSKAALRRLKAGFPLATIALTLTLQWPLEAPALAWVQPSGDAGAPVVSGNVKAREVAYLATGPPRARQSLMPLA